jgi:hypothetical protein
MEVKQICNAVLKRLCTMDFERNGGSSNGRLIFPNKFPSETKKKNITEEELLKYNRISEQELRFLFVEEFIRLSSKEFFYSVETPTENQYRFGKTYKDISCDVGRSASIDMSIFKKDENNKYKRSLNIEFKNENVPSFNIGKDILKLIHEPQNGMFIHLLKNTDSGTLCSSNTRNLGVFDKYYESFSNSKFQEKWQGDSKKNIKLIIISFDEKTLLYRDIKKDDDFEAIFKIKNCGNIATINGNGWRKVWINSLGKIVEN